MSYFRRLWLSLAAVVLLAASNLSSPEVVLQRMRAAQAEVNSLEARLEQAKSYPQLGIEDPPEQGRLYLARSDRAGTRVRIQIDAPEVRVLTVSDGGYTLYQPRIQQAVQGKLGDGGKASAFSGILTGSESSVEELEHGYAVEALGQSVVGERTVEGLRFTAKPKAEVYCHRIELFVDTTLWLPVKQTCEEANQSVITFELSDVELGKALDESLFELDLPAGVERVRG